MEYHEDDREVAYLKRAEEERMFEGLKVALRYIGVIVGMMLLVLVSLFL